MKRYTTNFKDLRVMELVIIIGILGMIFTGDIFKMGGR